MTERRDADNAAKEHFVATSLGPQDAREKIANLISCSYYEHKPLTDTRTIWQHVADALLSVFPALAQSNAQHDADPRVREALLEDGIRNLCYTAFQRRASGRNADDSGECDWINDTLPLIERGIKNLLATDAAPSPQSQGLVEAAEWQTVYLAARYSRAPELRKCRSDLEAIGLKVVSRWIDGGHELTKEGSTQAHEAERVRFAQEDKSDLETADCVISFTEEPRKTTTRGGRHVEFGIALARKQHVIVIGHRENVFHCLPQVAFFPTWDECLTALRSRASDRSA